VNYGRQTYCKVETRIGESDRGKGKTRASNWWLFVLPTFTFYFRASEKYFE
jgi:hypothetical protein